MNYGTLSDLLKSERPRPTWAAGFTKSSTGCPNRCGLPVVLCYLEEMSYQSAAHGWD